jgi:hypothetical protein
MPRSEPLTAEPSLYQINSLDDQRLEGAAQQTYDELARAIQAIEEIKERSDFVAVNAKILKPLDAAERALRRAAWLTVAYHAVR